MSNEEQLRALAWSIKLGVSAAWERHKPGLKAGSAAAVTAYGNELHEILRRAVREPLAVVAERQAARPGQRMAPDASPTIAGLPDPGDIYAARARQVAKAP